MPQAKIIITALETKVAQDKSKTHPVILARKMDDEKWCRAENSSSDRVTDLESPVRWTSIFLSFAVVILVVFLNTVVVLLSMNLKSLKGKEFRFFLLNLSIIDICAAISFLVFGLLLGGYPFFCFWGYLLYSTLGFASASGMLPIVFNRYISVCKPDYYDTFFGNRFKIFLVCMEPYLFAVFLRSMTGALGSVGASVHNVVCVMTNARMTKVSAVLNVAHLLPALFFFSFKLWRSVQEMKKVQMNLQLKKKLEETRFLLKTILVQALVPIPLQIPISIMSMMECSYFARWLYLVSLLLFFSTGSVDALSMLFFVKPYREALKSWWMGNKVVNKPRSKSIHAAKMAESAF